MKLLFTNAGRRTYLIEYALDIKRQGITDLDVFVCDTSKDTAAMWVAQEVKRFVTPHVSDDPEKYAGALLKKCLDYGIEVVIPLMDYELPVLAKWKDRFAANGITVIVASPDIIDTCLNKQRCHAFCDEHALHVPRSWYPGEATGEARPPLIMKKPLGSGSVGLQHIDTPDAIPSQVPPGFLLQEHIIGVEYGMDVLNGLRGEFIHCCLRRKLLMRAGETDKAEVIYDQELLEWGPIISGAFHHVGNMDVDFIVDHTGNIFFIDFNPRFGGGYPFTHAAGFNYLSCLLSQYHGQQVALPSIGKTIIGMKGVHLFTYEVDQ